MNGERRSFVLLRSIVDAAAQDRPRDAILNTYLPHGPAVAEATAWWLEPPYSKW